MCAIRGDGEGRLAENAYLSANIELNLTLSPTHCHMRMIKTISLSVLVATAMSVSAQNPLEAPFTGPHATPPFSLITEDMWMPAIERGIELQNQEIRSIVRQRSVPDFDNTIVALERSGEDLNRALYLFSNLVEADATPTLMDMSLKVSQIVSDHQTNIILNEALWQRVKAVYDRRADWHLNGEDSILLQNTYDEFAENGAALQGPDRETFRRLSAELSELTTRFGQNVLKELNTYEVWLTPDELKGIPESTVGALAQAAKDKGREGEYLATLDQPIYSAIMQYADNAALRERMYRLYNGRNSQGEYNNLPLIRRIADVRREIANLLGSPTYAQHSLRHTMAQKPENVYNLLNQLRDAYRPALEIELNELSEFATNLEGQPVTIVPWNYSYYSNKLRQARYSYDEEEMRPYFELNNVINGVFGLATKLYGLQFVPNDSIEVYHPDVKAFDVKDADGSLLGVLYTDFFPRPSKRPGAWMTNFREERRLDDGTRVVPLVSIVMNFTKPTDDKPALLTPYEVETFLHEFGHSLHGLLAQTKYASTSGTNVYRDFVELPSQFNENFLTQKEFLDSFAKHYQTGEPIPQELVDRIKAASQFGAAYATMRQLGFGYIDMAFYTATEPTGDPLATEYKALETVQVFPPVEGCAMSPSFNHIFSGGYAAGYYSYKWAEVLDADAFEMFEEEGIFNPATAKKFRDEVLSRGGTANPATLYRNFRGRDANIDALLIRDGIKSPAPRHDKLPVNKD